MKTKLLAATAAAFALFTIAAPVEAAVVIDPTGDFVPGYTGPQTGQFDVTGFSVEFNPETQIYSIIGMLAGLIDPGVEAYYAIGVNTGTGAIRPFSSLGQPNVIFNQVVVLDSEDAGDAFVGANDLDFTISGNTFNILVPLSLLPSTGADPAQYAFNLWPRTDLTPSNLAAISDFAPDNAMLHPTLVPEPGTWGMMLLGFVAAGWTMRRKQKVLPQMA
jgi:hypothetical protein